jgi:hypothetical protein
MIHKVLSLVADQLNAYIRLHLRVNEDKVVLSSLVQPDGSPGYPGENVIVATLVNIQEEKILPAAPPLRSSREGYFVKTNPPVCLNLYVLLAASFKVHAEALKFLSTVLAFYQEHRVLTRENAPGMDPALDTLIFELTTLGFQEQSNLWASLGAKYLPSVLFKIRMIRLEDGGTGAEVPAVAGISTALS